MKKFLSERDLLQLVKKQGKSVTIPAGSRLTPLAMDMVKSMGLYITMGDSEKPVTDTTFREGTVAVGSDHTGFEMKKKVLEYLTKHKIPYIDVGCSGTESCDYPDFAKQVATLIRKGKAVSGIMLDATGTPSAVVCNKVKGIVAAVCYNEFSARSARSHNNASVICLGAKTLGEMTILSILDIWFQVQFEGGRHQKRLDKISLLEEEQS